MDKLKEIQKDYDELKNKYNDALKEIQELKEHLKKYTAPERGKKYYQAHKEELIQKTKEYRKKTTPDPEKIKEYNRRSYLKRKAKLQSNKDIQC